MAIPTPFIGRRKELADLRTWLDDARSGQATIALISGELGIGKTRLVDEFVQFARGQDDLLVCEGRWVESREIPAYVGFREALWPLVSQPALREGLAASGTHWRELARLGPEFADALSVQPAEESRDEQFGLWRAVAELLTSAGSICPVVVSLDDIQWADRGSLGLLGFLGGEVRTLPVLFILTYRGEDAPPDHPLNSTIADLVRAQVLKTVYLGGLSRVEVGELAAGISAADVPSDVVDALHRETGGNPLFVGELVRDLVSARPEAARPAALSRSELHAPEKLRQVMARRLRALSDDCRLLLSLASVLGREFEIPVLEALTGLSRAALLTAIDEAIAAAMIDQVVTGRFSFHHPLLRNVVRAGLTPAQQIDAHVKAADALQRHYGPNAAHHAREIAGHLVASGGLADPGDTATYCLAGARQLRALFAFEEGRQLLFEGLNAVERLPRVDSRLRAAFLMELGYTLTALGQPDEALSTYRSALGVYQELRDTAGITDARRWLAATLARYGRWSEVIEVTESALAEADEARTYAYVGLVGSHTMASVVTARLSEAEPWIPRLLDLAFDDATRAVAHHVAACWHSYGGGDPGQANEYFFRARELFLRAGQDATAAGAALDHAFVAHFLGDEQVAAEAEVSAGQLAERTGRVATIADLHALRSVVHVQSGSWEDARHERELWRSRASVLGGRTVYGQLAERAEALEVLWRHGPEQALRLLSIEYPLPNEPLRAVLAVEAGDRERACQLLDAIQVAVPSDGRGLFWLSIALAVSSALCSLDDPRAADWFDALKRYEGCIFIWFSADVELARIAAVAGRWAEADERFTRASETLRERRLVPHYADALYQHALMLRRRRRAGDRARAEQLLREASQVFGEIGAEYMRDKVAQPLQRRGPGRPPSKGRGGLTTRETSVLALLAEGKSTRAIAQQLVVSERTVSRHLENIYAKFGVSNRTAAVARAVQEGVVDSQRRVVDEIVG